mmetsp:Transcript_143189/g.373135  ORF Transcript_143189/g.373135 Transcript_143189/m.373135 type:complete len:93 (+) Transcript_143189:734-1012(+)
MANHRRGTCAPQAVLQALFKRPQPMPPPMPPMLLQPVVAQAVAAPVPAVPVEAAQVSACALAKDPSCLAALAKEPLLRSSYLGRASWQCLPC